VTKETQKTLEQTSQLMVNVMMSEIPDNKERLYALMNLEQTMLWIYQHIDKVQKKAEAEARSV
jgi:hypothetical protein